MNEDAFWHVIALFDWEQEGDDDAVVSPAVGDLARRPLSEITEFEDLLADKLHAIDTREHARYGYYGELDPDDGDAYISADDFLYLRCVVVANGRQFYGEVLADPTKMPRDMEFEVLLSVAGQAAEEAGIDDYDHSPEPSYESFKNTAGWAHTDRTRPGRFTSTTIPEGNRRP